MGGLAGLHRSSGGGAASGERRSAAAYHRRRRRPRPVGGRAYPGLTARPTARRVQARIGAGAVDRDRARCALRRQALTRSRAHRGLAGGAGPPPTINPLFEATILTAETTRS